MPVLVLLILKAYFNSVVTFLVSLEYRLSYPSLHPALFILSSHSVRKLGAGGDTAEWQLWNKTLRQGRVDAILEAVHYRLRAVKEHW